MQTQKAKLDFKGQNIFAGIDVHLKSCAVAVLADNLVHKTFTQPACADTLSNYLGRNFPGGGYYSEYGAGFSSFWAHYKLKGVGINNIAINPAEPPPRRRNICKRMPRQAAGNLPGRYVLAV